MCVYVLVLCVCHSERAEAEKAARAERQVKIRELLAELGETHTAGEGGAEHVHISAVQRWLASSSMQASRQRYSNGLLGPAAS